MRPVMPNTATPGIGILLDRARKEFLHAREKRLFARLVATLLQRGLEFLEQFLLFGIEAHRRFDHHPAKQVPGRTAAHRPHALLANAKHAPGLGLAGDLDHHLAVERRHLDRTAQRRRGEADRHLAGQVAAVALENGVLAHADLHIEVARRTAVAAGFAFAVQADSVAGINSGRHRHRNRLLLAYAALSVAGVARIADDLAAALASRTRLLNGEDRLLHAHLALPVAGVAGLGRGTLGRAGSLAGLAFGQGGNLDFGLGAEHRPLQIEFELIAQIGTAKHLRASPLPAGENIAEHLAENIAERIAGAEAAAAAASEAGVAELIVYRALLRVGQHLVGLLGLLELVLGLRVVGVSIRMKLHGQAAIGSLYFRLGRTSRQIEELVVIVLRHCPPKSTPTKTNRRYLSAPAAHSHDLCRRSRRFKPSCDRFP